MKTKPIPAIVMLTAGLVLCIMSVIYDYGFSFLVRTLVWVLIGFYILGYIIKIVLDMNMNKLDDEITADDLGFKDGEILEDIDMELVEEAED